MKITIIKPFNNKIINISSRLLAKKIPDQDLELINSVCTNLDVPLEMVMCIYLIETHYRPIWFRTFEYIDLHLMIYMYHFWGWTIKDRSIGKCQIKLSKICEFSGIKFAKRRNRIYFKNKLSIGDIRKLLAFSRNEFINFTLCAREIKKVVKHINSTNNLSKEEIILVGLNYNGSVLYANLLLTMIKDLYQNNLINNTS